MAYRSKRNPGARTSTYRVDDEDNQPYENIPRLPERRRFTCPRCQSMFGSDISESESQQMGAEIQREPVGSPLSSFVSREELEEHVKRVHGGSGRLPSAKTRALGRIPPKPTESQKSDEDEASDVLGPESEKESLLGSEEDSEDILSGSDEDESSDSGDII